jgi:hypothetical protein
MLKNLGQNHKTRVASGELTLCVGLASFFTKLWNDEDGNAAGRAIILN